MAKQRTLKVNSVAGAAETFASATMTVDPPEHLGFPPEGLPHWRSIVLSRPAKHWTLHDLETAVELTRCNLDLERLRKQLAEEGYTFVNRYGEPKPHPLCREIDTLVMRKLRLARALHIHAEATEGSSHWQREKAQAERDTRAALIEDDGCPSWAARAQRRRPQ